MVRRVFTDLFIGWRLYVCMYVCIVQYICTCCAVLCYSSGGGGGDMYVPPLVIVVAFVVVVSSGGTSGDSDEARVLQFFSVHSCV